MRFFTDMTAINFTANLVDSPTIKQRKYGFFWKPIDVSIVELDSTKLSDVNALGKTSKSWEKKGAIYVNHILYNIIPYLKAGFADIKDHYYALTTQRDNFEKLEPENILGLMLFREKNDYKNEICYLEVSPSTTKRKNLFRKYKEVGKTLVEFVKSQFSQKKIEVWSDLDAIDFYKKRGFRRRSRNICNLCWWPKR